MCLWIIQKLCKGIHHQLFTLQKQADVSNYGPFAISMAAETLDQKSRMEARFDVERMRGHLIISLENKVVIKFPKVWKFHLSV